MVTCMLGRFSLQLEEGVEWCSSGSVLGPVLFLIYINDIDSGLSSTVLKFADDTKVFSVIDIYADGCGLQADLRNIEKWAELWQMDLM